MQIIDNNELVRNKYLGMVGIDNIDEFVKDKIAGGRFNDIYLGDYFKVRYNGKENNFRIYGINSDKGCDKAHLVIVPDYRLKVSKMSNSTGYGPDFSDTIIYRNELPEIDKNLEDIFGDHILTIRVNILNRCQTKEYEAKSMLMSEIEVFGFSRFSESCKSCRDQESQLPLFKVLKEYRRKSVACIWLRDKAGYQKYCFIDAFGGNGSAGVHLEFGILPRIIIG